MRWRDRNAVAVLRHHEAELRPIHRAAERSAAPADPSLLPIERDEREVRMIADAA
jgi:hypothetical protein